MGTINALAPGRTFLGVGSGNTALRLIGRPPALFEPFGEEDCVMLNAFPRERLHQRIHEGHNCWVLPEEERFRSPDLIEGTCLIGTAQEILECLSRFQGARLDEIRTLPGFAARYAVLEHGGRDIIPRC